MSQLGCAKNDECPKINLIFKTKFRRFSILRNCMSVSLSATLYKP